MSGPPVEQLSVWTITPLLALAMMAAHEAGVRLRVRARSKAKDEVEDAVGGHLGAALGLLALLIGFTFGMSMGSYNTRRTLVTEEASAIGTHYRRLLTVPEPQRTRLAGDLIRYLDAREANSVARDDRGEIATESGTEQTAIRLWLDTVAVAAAPNAPAQIQAVLGTTEAMIKAAAARRDAMATHAPVNVVRAMLLYALVAAGLMGYATKPGQRLFAASTVQFLMLSLAIALVLDLDRAHGGVIQVDESPLTRTAERIKRFEAAGVPTAAESSGASRPAVLHGGAVREAR